MPATSKPTARIVDPVFLVMLIAIVLAVASSFTLRLAAGCLGPTKAHADNASSIPPTHLHKSPPPVPSLDN